MTLNYTSQRFVCKQCFKEKDESQFHRWRAGEHSLCKVCFNKKIFDKRHGDRPLMVKGFPKKNWRML